MKRTLSILLALLLIALTVPAGVFTASAATSGTTGDCTWTLDGTVLTISGNGATGNNNSFWGNNSPWGTNITAVILEEGVTAVGSAAFLNSYYLESVTFPSSLTAIGYQAFSGCSSLTSVTIPGSVSALGNNAFYGCSHLTEVVFESGVTSIGSQAFYGCASLSRLVLPDTLTTIYESAFYNCSHLGIVDVPDTLVNVAGRPFICYRNNTYYHASAFALRGSADAPIAEIAEKNDIPFLPLTGLSGTTGDCTWTVDGTGKLTVSGEGEMDDYPTKVVGNLTVSTAPWGTFITSLVVEEGVTYIGEDAFYAAAVKSVTLPDTLEAIGDEAFWCADLTAVNVPASVWYIGDQAFRSCESLTQVHVPDTLLYMGEEAFLDCDGLADENDLVIVGGVLFDYTHVENPSRRHVTVPEGVTVIEKGVFLNHDEITSVDLPDSLVCIKSGAFADCDGLYNSNRIMYVDNWLCIASEDNITSLAVPEGIVGIADYFCSGWKSKLTSVTLPSTLRYIGEGAFSNCYSLTDVTMGSNVLSIDSGAFYASVALERVNVPASVIFIGEGAFQVLYEDSEYYEPLPKLTMRTSRDCLAHKYAEAAGIPVQLSEHVHTFVISEIVQMPTCTAKGVGKQVCAFCGAQGDNCEIDAYGHDYGFRITPPTCTEEGCTTHVCTRCGDTYTDGKTAALGHDYRDTVTRPTCTEGGCATHVCTRCGDTYVDGETAATGHAFGAWTQTKAPTCTEKGEESRACSVCDAVETREIAANGHDFSLPAHKDAAGRVEGYDGHVCSVCGALKIDAVLPATGIATGLAGDLDWDNAVTDDDAIWLLMYAFFPDDYPVDEPMAYDFDGDGSVTDDDAIWLLMYTFFPDDYPIA